MLESKIKGTYVSKPENLWFEYCFISELDSEKIEQQIPHDDGIYKTSDDKYFQVINKKINPITLKSGLTSDLKNLLSFEHVAKLSYDQIDMLFDKYWRKLLISQGDVFYNFKMISPYVEDEITLPYVMVLSQDCDLQSMSYEIDKLYNIEQSEQPIKVKQFIPNVLLVPAFSSAHIFDNTYLEKIYKITSVTEWKSSSLKDRVRQNKDDRYHCFRQFGNIPELVVDFKCYFSVPILGLLNNKYKAQYLTTINELFRESLSQRFANYLCRIGLPPVDQH